LELRKKYGYPELTPEAKRKILGLNAANLYGVKTGGNLKTRFKPVPADYEKRISNELKTILEFPGYTADNMSRFKQQYAQQGALPNHTRYGWIRAKA
jgi:hypothetical protein